ncbi:hypothetical protein DRQ25_18120 [Candidatus Fermentibacteria bacterium]|nr:MAG: hypothetical protein DRQ25_18120 [Candidatus Fermentibacteria bacterium]
MPEVKHDRTENRILFSLSWMLMLILPVLAVAGEAEDAPGWVVSCRVVEDENVALREMSLLDSLGYECGVLWMADWPSLGGYEGWMIYAGPVDSRDEAEQVSFGLLWRFPDAMGVLVHEYPSSCGMLPTPDSMIDLTGLFPPIQDFMYSVTLPGSWQVSLEVLGPDSLDEWDRPVHITQILPGWRIEKWEDIYLGTVEVRAYRQAAQINAQLFERQCRYIRDTAASLGASVFEEHGKYILLHCLPDTEDRNGDTDFWAVLSGDSIEYGYRCRSFYGEMPYSWRSIPSDARESLFPIVFDSDEGAIDILYNRLLVDGIYDRISMEEFSYGIEYMDSWEPEAYRDYRDVAVREVHREGGSGDPNTAPIVDRFRIYSRTGEVLWWHPLYGEFVRYIELFAFKDMERLNLD